MEIVVQEKIPMSVVIPNDVLFAAKMTEAELMREIAVMLFQQERITLGTASKLSSIDQIEFQRLLSSRGICRHYDVADYEADLKNLHENDRR